MKESSENLNSSQKNEVAELSNEYKDIFAKSSGDLGRTGYVKHGIDTGNTSSIKQPYVTSCSPVGSRKASQTNA